MSNDIKERFQLCQHCWEFFSLPPYKDLCKDGTSANYFMSMRGMKPATCKWCSLLEGLFDPGMHVYEVDANIPVQMSWDTDPFGSSPSGRNRLRLKRAETDIVVSTIVTLSTEPEDPAAGIVTSRKRQHDVDCDFAYDEAQRWLVECKDHVKCVPAINKDLPTRIIDVSISDDSPECRLIETKGARGEYVALSYCWGSAQRGITTGDNIDERRTKLKEGFLSRTVQEAIRVTRRLGYRYLWVDAICILQDSQDDMIRELGRMSEIFRNATVTIVAASAASSADGFLARRHSERDSGPPFRLPFWCNNALLGSVLVDAEAPHIGMEDPIALRAWTLQEVLLSPRLLIYAAHTLQYQCNTQHVNLGSFYNGISYCLSRRLPVGLAVPLPEYASNDLLLMIEAWSNVVSEYSTRETTLVKDKFPALSAIAQMFGAELNSDYVAGLWTGRWLPSLLLWRADYGLEPYCFYVAPTWSWACAKGGTWWHPSLWDPSCGGVCNVTILQAICIPAIASLPFGEIIDASLLLNGHMCQGLLRSCTFPAKICSVEYSNSTGTQIEGPPEYALDIPTYHWQETCVWFLAILHQQISSWDGVGEEEPLNWEGKIDTVSGLIVLETADGKAYRRIGVFYKASASDFAQTERRDVMLI